VRGVGRIRQDCIRSAGEYGFLKGYRMEEIGFLLLLAGVLGLALSLVMLSRRKRVTKRSLPDNFDFADRKYSERRR